ncbi:hypothetical protein [Floridanema aerugineum]|uniref:Nucleoside phosphorylase domain-containing protein n=1 Tax=Floridaenema aerugineum BLCC-F46 TaxID=3153654 RepID=A0ABV4X4Q2_9CYAN
MTTQLFSDLEINDVLQLESALQNLLMQIDTIAGRRSLLQLSGIDAYFISNLDFNLNISEFVTILTAKFKNYKIPNQQIYKHPMLALIEYIIKQQKYNLADEDIKIFTKILQIAESKMENLMLNNQEENLALPTSATKGNENVPDSFIPPEDGYKYQIEQQAWYAPGFPETEEILEEELQALKQEIDVVLITATDVELKAVARHLKPYPKRTKILLVYSGPETYYLGKFGAFNTVLTKCRMGAINEGSVILATEQAQRFWSPKAIIMVGIAFGKSPANQRIGDVLVASQIISYEQQRIGEGGIIYRGSISPSNTTLLNRFENVQNWKFDRPDRSYSKIIIGPILSGEKLIDDPVFKASLFKQFPQAVGGEMEGAGLCAASGRVGTAWILIKSICDWGDGKKHKKHQPLAAAAAADLVHYVLSQKTVLNGIKKL